MCSLAQTAPAESNITAFVPIAPAGAVKAPRSQLPWRKILIAAAIVVAVGAGAGGELYHAAGFETTDDAYLEGDVHPVSPRINGTVLRVLVNDNDRVAAGQPLVEIDPADLNLAVQAASAELTEARAAADQVTAQISRAQSEVEAAQAHIEQNAAELDRAQLDFHRMESLANENVRAISTQELDAARAAFDSAQAAQQSLIAEHSAAQAALAAAKAQRAVATARIQGAQAALGIARLQAEYTVIRAPVSGRVAKKSVEAGQRLQPGQPVMAVVDDNIWVVANFKESQLNDLRAGQKVAVSVDAIEGRTFTGVVQSFSPGTGAQFSLLPPDNATGNFTKVVQRLPVKILFAADTLGSDAERVYPGLSAVVSVNVRH